jgi:cytochrome c oxidase subunit II
MRDRATLLMVAAGVAASAAGIVLGLSINWFPTIASKQADRISTLYDVLIIASVPIFVLVVTVVLGSVIRFRMRPGQEDQDGPPIHGNTRLEVLWTALPALLILGLCTYAYTVLHDIEKAPAAQSREIRVGVHGQQFAWTFAYPSELTGAGALRTTELVLPRGTSVRFNIDSADVIHDFWVPDFSMKIDAVPGVTTHYRVTPTRLGTYPVVCAELCGLGHSVMRTRVRVVTPTAFTAWMRQQTRPAAPATASPAATAQAGRQVFADNGCSGCHTLADADAHGQIGPNLDDVLKDVEAAKVREDIVAPNKEIAQGYGPDIMPQTFGQTLTPSQLDALVAYLKEATS